MNVPFIVLVLIFCSYALSNGMLTDRTLCHKTANYCKIQCKYGNQTFHKAECNKECDKNNKTCEYLYSSNCVLPTTQTDLLNTSAHYNDSTPCFHDYAYEYFCRHIYDPCRIAANGSKTLNDTCAKRFNFCECGLKYYLSRNQTSFSIGTTLPPPREIEEHTEPSAYRVDNNFGLFLPDAAGARAKGRGKRSARYRLSFRPFDYP